MTRIQLRRAGCLRRPARVLTWLVGLLFIPLLAGCSAAFPPGHGSSLPTHGPRALVPPDNRGARFVDVADQAGITFRHNNGSFGRKLMPETTGAGCAFLDYDRDGWEDLLFVNSGELVRNRPKSAGPKPRTNVALYRNNRDGTFTEEAERAGLIVTEYGMGVCVGDYDNDGFDDVYITCLGPNHLFRNTGHGTFTDVTSTAGVAGMKVNGSLQEKWSSSAAWLDYNRDGRLDLFVGNFVEWSPAIDVFCGQKGGVKDYCAPGAYKGLTNTLYRSNPDGTFTDASVETHIGEYMGKAWGVATWDFNGDGWPDIAVSNDTEPNFLFVNHGGKYFTEDAAPVGIALDEAGHAKAGMGVDVADWNNDGRFSLLVGNFSNEKLSLFRSEGGDLMRDVSDEAGVGVPSLQFLTFGVFFFDYDLDGWQDVFAANGHIQELVQQYNTQITYRERPLLYHNERNGRFVEVGEQAGEPLRGRYVLRGCATGDFDNDGDPDIIVSENNGRARLWRNDLSPPRHWVRFQLRGTRSNRAGIGALITVTAGKLTQRQWVKSGGSFLSQNSLTTTFGLGDASEVDQAEVLWPDGHRDRIPHPALNRLTVVTEGASK